VVSLIGLSMMAGAIAVSVGLRGTPWRWKIGGAALLPLAIRSHHFTAMSAVTITANPAIAVSPAGRDRYFPLHHGRRQAGL
jgi:NO-binding membrane sensor protein with MHYT domain